MPRRLALLVAALLLTGAGQHRHDDREACRLLSRHVPDPNVEFTPGFDVRGRPVAPADLPGSHGAQALEPRVEFELSSDLVRRFPLPRGVGQWLGKSIPGRIVVEDNRIYYNGTLLSDADEAEFAVICRDLLR